MTATNGIEQYLFKGPWAGEPGTGKGALDAMRELCSRCEHRDACLLFALGNREVEGVWAGTTTAQRRKPAGLPIPRTDARTARASSSHHRRSVGVDIR